MQTLFEDTSGGGFFTTSSEIPARLLENYDGPVPSGNSAALMLLLRLSAITGREQFARSADKALRRFQGIMDREPMSHAFMLLSADAVINGTREVVVSAKTAPMAEPFLKGFRGRYLPDITSFVLTDGNKGPILKLSPLAEGRSPGSETLAYVCQDFTCKIPAKSPAELEAQLGKPRS
jgi:uncharacterized protein YyaL (SSP411 family)